MALKSAQIIHNTESNKMADTTLHFGNNIYCTEKGTIYLIEAPKHQIIEPKRGNKFDRTDAWLERHDYVVDGDYMGNCNTLVYHEHGCSDVSEMNEEHKVETDNEKELYRPCGHCKPHLSKSSYTFNNYKTVRDEPDDIEICYDKKVAKIFQDLKCDCGSSDGIIKMRPHSGGVRLLGDNRKMWIWRECSTCGHQLSLTHALQQRKAMKTAGEI